MEMVKGMGENLAWCCPLLPMIALGIIKVLNPKEEGTQLDDGSGKGFVERITTGWREKTF